MYTWIVIVGGIFAFGASMGIGANDVANAYATAIGSRSLTLKQAIVLASIFESGGAILMGSHVTKTIRKGIADYECFENDPGPLMYGSMWVCLSVGLWLFLASKYEMPVSTTHSCVGGMIGMTIALKGTDCVIWYEEKDNFPYIGGVSGIVLSWVISPVFSAILSSILFFLLRCSFLRSANSYSRSTYIFPILVGGTITLNSFYIIYKGAKGLGLHNTPLDTATAWSLGIGGAFAVVVFPLTRYIQNSITKRFARNAVVDTEISEIQEVDRNLSIDVDRNTNTCTDISNPSTNTSTCSNKKETTSTKISKYINNSLTLNLDKIINDNNNVKTIHDRAEKFDPKTEELFKSLQVFTSICDSFSHGANDVANAIGPFAAIYMIYQTGTVEKKSELGSDAYWILAMGGIGISVGLCLYGYKIIQAIGIKLCKITPSRGVAIELSSAIVIITGSRLGIPLSTTHCQIGATLGVAALENPRTCSGMNFRLIIKTIIGWFVTLIVVGGSTAILTAQGAHAPEVK